MAMPGTPSPDDSGTVPPPAPAPRVLTAITRDELDNLLSGFQASLERQLDAREAAGAIPGSSMPMTPGGLYALAESIMQSPQWMSWQQRGIPNLKSNESLGDAGIRIPSLLFGGQLSAIGLPEVGDLVQPFRRPDIVSPSAVITGLLDDIPCVGLGGINKYEYIREHVESQFSYLKTKLATNVVADAGAVLTFVSVDGVMVGTAFRVFAAGGMQTTPKVQSIDAATKVVTFESNITFGALVDDVVAGTYFGAIGESAEKPEGFYKLEDVSLTTKTFPILYPVTQQAMDVVSLLLQLLETRMRLSARINAEWHMIYGNGGSAQCHGFFTETGAQTHLWSDGEVGDNKLDCIRRAISKVRPRGNIQISMNPDDWDEFALLKDSQGRYIHTSTAQGPVRVVDEPNDRRIGSNRVRLLDTLVKGDFLVANHFFASGFLDQERSRFAVGWVNDQFKRNERTLLYEDNYEHAIFDLKAYCTGQFDGAPVA